MQQFLQAVQNNAVLLLLVLVWSVAWKGFALWRAARNNSVPRFVALLVINTLGLLEILYLFVFGKRTNRVPPAGPANPQA